MQIFARLENLNFRTTMLPVLRECGIEEFEAGKMARVASFILNYKNNSFGISQWVSPKRTRSYPYARVYDTMGKSFRVTIIPFVKDEGFDGDRDFIQWDSVSLMSLLNVYVIIGYYQKAEKNLRYRHKITNQVFDYKYPRQQLDLLIDYKSSALHWNLNQLDNLLAVAERAKAAYQTISDNLCLKMHSVEGIDKRIEILKGKAKIFKQRSRKSAREAQDREFQTIQPKEKIEGFKAKITIRNYLGGVYYFTVDELKIRGNKLFLLEMKHTKRELLPSCSDIKDGIVKMMLFANLSETRINKTPFEHFAVLGLTSAKFEGYCHSRMPEDEILTCLRKNKLSAKQEKRVLDVFGEGRVNNFLVFLMDSNNPNYQDEILRFV